MKQHVAVGVLVFVVCVLAVVTAAPEAKERVDPNKPKKTPPELTKSQRELLRVFRSEFVAVSPGSFLRGSKDGPANERPVARVTLEEPFHIAAYEVPQNLWLAVMGTDPSRWKGPRNSVELLSFAEALEFCRKATALMRRAGLIGESEIVRLPSEAEWEYCARAGTKTRYSFGDSVDALDAHAWSTRNAAGNDPPVGAKKPNPWKLYDMHGYLWEWCLDSWSDDYKEAPADGRPRLVEEATYGVLRGGSWRDPAEKLTSSYRRKVSRDTRGDEIGLRCVLSGTSEKNFEK